MAYLKSQYDINDWYLKLDGKKVIVKSIVCYHYDKKSDTAFTYVEEVVYHYDNEDKAMEYYYKMR